jgi:hypothetical protein
MKNIESPELRVQLEAIGNIPRIVEFAQSGREITLVGMLRYLDIPYGIGSRALDVMKGAGMIVPSNRSVGWELAK